MYDDYYRRGAGIFGSFMLGAIIGGVLGLLFSPRSGRENREMLADKAQEYWGEGKEMFESGRERMATMYESGRERAGETAEQIQEKIDAARERLKEQVAKTGEKVSEGAKAAKEPVDKAAEAAKAGVDTAKGKAQDALDFVAEKTASQPAPVPGAPDVPPGV